METIKKAYKAALRQETRTKLIESLAWFALAEGASLGYIQVWLYQKHLEIHRNLLLLGLALGEPYLSRVKLKAAKARFFKNVVIMDLFTNDLESPGRYMVDDEERFQKELKEAFGPIFQEDHGVWKGYYQIDRDLTFYARRSYLLMQEKLRALDRLKYLLPNANHSSDGEKLRGAVKDMAGHIVDAWDRRLDDPERQKIAIEYIRQLSKGLKYISDDPNLRPGASTKEPSGKTPRKS